MKSKRLSLTAVALVCIVLMVISCKSLTINIGSPWRHRHGPPPHAPAHGYRHKHHGLELVFDAEPGVYVVVGFPHHYYCRGHYYWYRGPMWEMSTRIDGPWKPVSEDKLPPGLRADRKIRR